MKSFLLISLLSLTPVLAGTADISGGITPSTRACPTDVKCVLVDDFESYEVDGLPLNWKTYQRQNEIAPVGPSFMNDRERFIIKQENGDKFVRAIVNGEAHRLLMPNDDRFQWRLDDFPIISWKWRADHLPVGAREDQKSKNDTGAAVYVVFGKDFWGRPRSIKYTYSSSLSVGTTASYGPLKILVLASEPDDGTGRWITYERNVADDYRLLFGKNPPNEPVAIMLWSDSDTVNSTAEVDFDDVMLLSKPSSMIEVN